MHRARATLFAILACLVLATPAAAAKPTTERVDLNDVGIFDPFLTEVCGVDIFFDGTGHIIFRTFTDAEGNVTHEVNNFAIQLRWYTDSASVQTVDVGVDRVTYNEDGSITRVIIGSVQGISLPGQGRVYADVGQTTILITFPDPEGEPVVEIQRQVGQHYGDQLAVICEALAP